MQISCSWTGWTSVLWGLFAYCASHVCKEQPGGPHQPYANGMWNEGMHLGVSIHSLGGSWSQQVWTRWLFMKNPQTLPAACDGHRWSGMLQQCLGVCGPGCDLRFLTLCREIKSWGFCLVERTQLHELSRFSSLSQGCNSSGDRWGWGLQVLDGQWWIQQPGNKLGSRAAERWLSSWGCCPSPGTLQGCCPARVPLLVTFLGTQRAFSVGCWATVFSVLLLSSMSGCSPLQSCLFKVCVSLLPFLINIPL